MSEKGGYFSRMIKKSWKIIVCKHRRNNEDL
jgi:hypothetical protein